MFRLFFYIIFLTSVIFSQSELSERYTTLEEIESQLNTWYNDFSQNTDPYPVVPGEEGIIYHHEIIGYSGVDNSPIWAVKLTMNANLNEDKPKVLILGQCHAEEIYGVEIAMGLIDFLLYPMNNPSYYQSILAIMENSEIWIVPTHNPEGLSVVHGWYDDMDHWNQDVYYRKNKYDANNNNTFDFIMGIGNDEDGVDLNRNYDFNWIFGDGLYSTDLGCGANPSYIANYDYYRGPYPFSENEVVAIRDFVLEHNFLLSIAYHSSRSGCVAEKVIYPWEWTPEKKSPDFDIISRLGSEMTEFLPKEAESGYYASASSVSRRGNAHDWIYANTGCIQYLVEVGTENMQSNDVAIIDETVEKNIISALHMIKRAAGTNIQGGPEKYQITGLITDANNGEPLNARVWIDELNGPMLKDRYSDDFGRYRRLLIEGTYTIHFDAFGYSSHEYTFVPSSSQITEYDVELQPLDYFNLSLDLDLPTLFDEDLTIVISSEKGFENITINNSAPSWFLPEGEYSIFISSDNIYPESFTINLNESLSVSKNIKWKSTLYKDDFSSLSNWNNQGWVLDDGVLVSQSDFLYANSSDLSLVSLFQIFPGEYMAKLMMRYELEWEYDEFKIYLQSDNQDVMIGDLTGHNYTWEDNFFNFSLDNNSSLKLDFTSDESLDYRGIEIDHMLILEKPEGECTVGDLSQNVLIDIVDIIMMVNFIMDENATGFETCLSDINLDNMIDVSDVVLLVNIILERN